MHRNFLAFFISSLIILSIGNAGCTKVDTTTIGSDLIPGIDNVHTFDTTLIVDASQGLFNDSTRVTRAQNHVIGNINNDPLFGKTNANLFLELKPSFFPYYFGNAGDTISGSSDVGVDSVVLCLSFKGLYGDSTTPQSFEVYQMNNATTNFVDSSYKLNFQPNVTSLSPMLGSVTVDPRALSSYTYFANRKDSAQNQIRIKLSTAFRDELFGRDSTTGNTLKNAFHSDSLFKTFYKGFEIRSTSSSSNSLFYVALEDATTRLEVHYRKRNKGKVDTTYTSFPFSYTASTSVSPSSHANYLKRDQSGVAYSNTDDNVLYIQSTPGTYANLKIPSLATFPNSIIHRAELIVEQVPTDIIDKALISPSYLYVDLAPTGSSSVFKPIYYDLDPTASYEPDNSAVGYFLPVNGTNFNYFGGYARTKSDYLGNSISFYNFNLSRYVQNTITKRSTNYDLRLYAPFNLDYYGYIYPFNNSLAYGRVKIGSGKNPNYKLRMHIIYSKI